MEMTMSTPVIRRSMRIGLATSLALLAVIGVMHTKVGRPLMGAVFGQSCPLDKVTPAQVEAGRQRGLERLRGNALAPSRPALGFLLDQTTEEQAVAWAEARHLHCAMTKKGMHRFQCDDVPASALGDAGAADVNQLTLAFNPAGKLVAIDTWRAQLDAPEAASNLQHIRERLSHALGTPKTSLGESTPDYLGSGYLHTASAQYRFSDYLASVTATNLGQAKGIAVREQYQSALREQPAASVN
jgi:hypothetical protein